MKPKELKEFNEYGEREIKKDFPQLDVRSFHRFIEVKYKGVFTFTPDKIRASHWVAAISFGPYRFRVIPKLLKEDSNGEDRKVMSKNLTHMLSYTHRLNIKDSEIDRFGDGADDFLEIYYQIYTQRLSKLLGNNPPRRYHTKEENLGYKRGRIDVIKNMRLNLSRPERLFCRYDEFGQNNIVSQVLKYANTLVLKNSRNPSTVQKAGRIGKMMVHIDEKIFDRHKIKAIKLNRNNEAFSDVFNLAKMFIAATSFDMGRGRTSIPGLVFDMNKLFEEYLYELIRRNKKDLNLKEVEFQGSQPLITGYREVGDQEWKGRNKYSYNDIVLTFKTDKILIIDTKYKILENISSVDSGDIYQALAYKTIAEKKDTKVLLLYPEEKEAYFHELKVAGGGGSVFVATVSLKENLCETKGKLIVKRLEEIFKGIFDEENP